MRVVIAGGHGQIARLVSRVGQLEQRARDSGLPGRLPDAS